LKQRLKAIEAKEDAQKRKDETRAKVLGGAFLFHHAASDPKIREWVAKEFPKFSKRPADTELVALFLRGLTTPQNPSS
jgi:hypothetical protein